MKARCHGRRMPGARALNGCSALKACAVNPGANPPPLWGAGKSLLFAMKTYPLVPCLLLTALLSLPAASAFATDEKAPELLYEFPSFTEGPVFDAAGNFFVSEPYAGRVTKIAPDGARSLWIERKLANGHKVLPDGNHLLCVEAEVLLLDGSGRLLRKMVTNCEGIPLRAPNDLVLDRHGGFYFTDPGGSREKPIGTVHYVDPQGVAHLVAGGLWVPNGVVLSPDGAFVYVAETGPNRILKYSVGKNGMLGPVTIFALLPARPGVVAEPDGIAIDQRGNLYVAHLGMTAVQVIDANGRLVESLPSGDFDTSNVVFGGAKLNELYITGSIGSRNTTPGRVYRLKLPEATPVATGAR